MSCCRSAASAKRVAALALPERLVEPVLPRPTAEMETNNHFNFTGLSSAPAASGPKPTPASGDSPFAHSSPLSFPPQGKKKRPCRNGVCVDLAGQLIRHSPAKRSANPRRPAALSLTPVKPRGGAGFAKRGAPPGDLGGLNGGMNVNGFSTVSHPSTSGTFTPSSPPAGTPPLRAYDCLWDYAPYPPAAGLKDGSPATPPLSGLGQFPLNGVAGGSRPASPGHGTNLRGAGQEFWGNGTPGPMGLNFDSQELYDSFHDQSFELMQNGPTGFYTAAQPSPMLGSGTQPFSLPPGPPEESGAGEGDADAAAKEIPPAIAENGGGLVGSMELEEVEPDLKICGYNGSAPGVVPLGQEGPVLAPGAGSGCLGDASPIAPRLEDAHILSEDPLEPFESLARGREAAAPPGWGGSRGRGGQDGQLPAPGWHGHPLRCPGPAAAQLLSVRPGRWRWRWRRPSPAGRRPWAGAGRQGRARVPAASLPRQPPPRSLPSLPSQLRDEAVTQRLNFRAGEHHRHRHGHFGLLRFPEEGAWLGALNPLTPLLPAPFRPGGPGRPPGAEMWVCVPPAQVLVLTPPPDPGTGDLYAMDDSQLVSDKSPLEEPPELPGLRCASPPLHAAGPFGLLPAGPGSPPTLHGTCRARTGCCPPAGRSPPAPAGPRPRGTTAPPASFCLCGCRSAFVSGQSGDPGRVHPHGGRTARRCGRLPPAGREPLRGGSSTPRVPPASSGKGCAATSPLGQAGAVWCHGWSRKVAALGGDVPDLGSADSSVDVNSSGHAGPEESASLDLDPPLEPESPAPSAEEEEEEEEEAADSCPETSAAPEGESEEAAPLSASAAGEAEGPRGHPPPASAPESSVPSPLSQVMSPAGASPPRRRCAFPCSMGTWRRPPPPSCLAAAVPPLRPAPRLPRGAGLKLLVPRWRREVRIKKGNHRWQGETWYYGPCGKRMKQFPEVIKYLSRNVVQDVRREHFSFSPRMPVGDFYEERDTPEGLQWVKLSPEEIPSRIQAITGKRGRPRNAEKAKPKEPPAAKRGRGRPPKVKMVDLLSKTDARLLKRLEAQGTPSPAPPARGGWCSPSQPGSGGTPAAGPSPPSRSALAEVLSDEDKLKMSKIKKKMRRKAKNKQKQEAKAPRAKEAKKKSKAKEKKGKPEKGKDKARPKEKKGKGARKVDKGLLAQRRLEERRRQQLILEEMKKPTEDMCLGDHQPLPAFSRIPGLILPSRAFSNCLTVVEFLQSYGKVLGFDPAKDVPSLCALQEGLLGVGDSVGEVQDLLVRLLQAALYDPGLPPYCQVSLAPAPSPAGSGLSVPVRPRLLRARDRGARIWAAPLLLRPLAPSPCAWQPSGAPTSVLPRGLERGGQAAPPGPAWLPGLVPARVPGPGFPILRGAGVLPFLVFFPLLVPLPVGQEGTPQLHLCSAQSLKILGEKVSEISLNRDTVSEILRCFLTAYGAGEDLCDGLRTKPFQALPPEKKAAILAFLVNELNSSALIINEIDKTLENMSNYRKNKWIIEGRLRRLKVALAKKTGRPESEITGLEDGRRRRSSRLTEETGLEMEEEEESRGRKSRREEEADTSASSVPELERQIEKLAKRQMFFRKKLLHSSQTLRAASLGQDRYRRRYWVLPHLGGIFVEGAEVAEPAPQEPPEEKASPRVSPVKEEPVDVPVPSRTNCTASRSRGRPRKSKEELSPHCGPRPAPVNGVLEESVPLGQSQHDLSQSAFLSWLSQTQSSLLKDSVLTPDSSPGKGETGLPPLEAPSDPAEEEEEEEEEESALEAAEKRGPWFNLLPRTPCDDRAPLATSSTEPSPRAAAQPRGQPRGELPKGSARQLNGLPTDDPTAPPLASVPVHAGARAHGTCPRSQGSLEKLQDLPGQPKRRGRPPTKFFKQIEQKYLTQLTEQPVPPEMQSGWWWLQDPEELEAVARALHPRGIREKALHKHLTKHKEFLREVCLRTTTDPIFHLRPEAAGATVSQEALARWSVMERAYETDLSVLQWVEELEQRVLMADLQIRGWTCPSPDSTRDDLQYCEHKVEPLEDITVRSRRDGLPLCRERTNPLDLAVLRLAALEQNVERRYLKEPLWPLHEVVVEKAVLSSPEELSLGPTEIAYEITPRVRTWRQTLERCRSAAQVSLCIYQLEKSIAWEKSVNRVVRACAALPGGRAGAACRRRAPRGGSDPRASAAEPPSPQTCLVCRRGDDDEHLLLCDGCDRGCHLYCHRPKMTEVPEGDWFCSVCVSRAGEYQDPVSPRRGKKRKRGRLFGEEEESPRRRSALRRREGLPVPRYAGEGLSPAKRRGATLRGQPSDLTFCEIILMEMESHEDAWPFLEPVNPRLVPGYRKIIKNPMDFATMRTRLLRGGYSSSEEFAADAMLVFDNCQTFNEDDSDVGKAGHAMRKFFESRWEEFYQGKHATNP
ncbi:hypothetical protein QYF61_006355 [Mycteria americana]|uniref:Bromodomain adjacent to zinc finger domain 2A n=1 Tax=Mycteria americana TaxID=33587 RepID=A0AAN7MJN8_MYCAM|nr:hypothetical protein QYF61_006355 [Mycteria americana]